MSALRILVCEDGEAIRSRLGTGWALAGAAANPTEAVRLAVELRPDAVLVWAGMDGWEKLVRRLSDRGLQVAVVVPSPDVDVWSRSISAGAAAVSGPDELDRLAGMLERALEEARAEESERSAFEAIRKRVESEARERLRMGGRVVALYSLKGGVGKTTVTAALARALERLGLRVAAVDLDMFSPDLADAFGYTEARRPAHDMAEWLELRRRGEEIDGVTVPEWMERASDGIWLLAPPARLEEAVGVDAESVRWMVGIVRRAFDVTLLDLGASPADDATVAGLQAADRILFVTTPDLIAVKHIWRVQDYFEAARVDPVRTTLVLNRMPKRWPVTEEQVARASQFPIRAVLPEDPGVRLRGNRMEAVERRGDAFSRAVVEMARAMAEEMGFAPKAQPPVSRGIFGFLRRW